jgi:hypothetical protein
MGLEWVAPTIAGIFLLTGTVATLIINSRVNKRANQSTHAPDVTEAWREADSSRAASRVWEDLYYLVKGAFKGYARRMSDLHGDDAKLNALERVALEKEIPRPQDPTSQPPKG